MKARLEGRRRVAAALAGIGTGLAMMLYGACRGEVSTVLNKAINICLECIGLG